ncbi:MAG: hypothetical protein C3F02_01145 [Parcubacteria group bacterium]|nr:MAG: hypothetical protein C3F02_01145 [Parcubacteria group bacterium]
MYYRLSARSRKKKYMNKEKIVNLIILLILLAAVGSSFYFYPLLPAKVVTHWGINGEANGWSSKNFQVIFFPSLLIFMWLLFKFLPHIDPLAKGYKEFKFPYLVIQLCILSLLSVIYIISNLVNVGYNISIGWTVTTLIGLMFIFMGLYLPQIKPNWFVGIRTPWTISSPYVWAKTHKFGAKMFIIAGLLFILTPYYPDSWTVYTFILAMALILSTIVYSYFAHRSESRGKA